jgi:hypothetical protein
VSKIHYKLSPSAAYRWSSCPGSLELNEGIVSESSVYAEEGTRAHDVAELIARDLLTLGFVADEAEYVAAGHSQEMVTNALRYAKVIQQTIEIAESNGHKLVDAGLETALVHSAILDFGGTADCYLLFERPDGRFDAWVIDYKYGTGLVVEAEGNLQLLAYATLLQNLFHDKQIEFFGGVIVQPRAEQTGDGGVRYARFGSADVRAFEALCVRASESDQLLTGDHCRWCPAATQCPALLEKARNAVMGPEPTTAQAQHEQWVELLNLAPALKALLDAIPKKMIEAIRLGAEFPGYKVVESTGHRAWKYPDEKIFRVLKKYGLSKKACLTEPVLKSPAQVEKLLPEKDVLEVLVERPKRGLTIAKSSDRRPAVDFASVAAEDLSVGEVSE